MKASPVEVGVKALLPHRVGNSWLYLFLERSRISPGETMQRWDMPGGRVKPKDKTLLDGLYREIHEETALRIISKGTNRPVALRIQTISRPEGGLNVERVTNLALTEPHRLHAVRLSKEHSDYVYLPRREALDLPIDARLRAVLEDESLFQFETSTLEAFSMTAVRNYLTARNSTA